VALPEPASSSTALVTGASSGIGAAIARELASRGHGVTLVARRNERLRELASELSGEHGVRAETIGADLTEAAARDRLARDIEGLGLDVDVLVNNAGFGAYGEFARIERGPQIEMVRINVEAVVDLAARYLPGMVERGRGSVINIASTAAFQPMPGAASYAASKAFVLSHGEAIHEEVKGSGVTVTTVCPGPVRTEFTEVAGITDAEETTPGAIWMSAEEVAEHAVDGAERGRRVVVPGLMNQAGAFAGQHSPRMLALPLVKRIWGRAV
jgi:short-subunit dehydrogenase